jgi:hypothetical protein
MEFSKFDEHQQCKFQALIHQLAINKIKTVAMLAERRFAIPPCKGILLVDASTQAGK